MWLWRFGQWLGFLPIFNNPAIKPTMISLSGSFEVTCFF